MVDLVYVGPHDEVSVPDADVVVARDNSALFPEDVAESLLQQGPAHWRKAEPAAKPAKKQDEGVTK